MVDLDDEDRYIHFIIIYNIFIVILYLVKVISVSESFIHGFQLFFIMYSSHLGIFLLTDLLY